MKRCRVLDELVLDHRRAWQSQPASRANACECGGESQRRNGRDETVRRGDFRQGHRKGARSAMLGTRLVHTDPCQPPWETNAASRTRRRTRRDRRVNGGPGGDMVAAKAGQGYSGNGQGAPDRTYGSGREVRRSASRRIHEPNDSERGRRGDVGNAGDPCKRTVAKRPDRNVGDRRGRHGPRSCRTPGGAGRRANRLHLRRGPGQRGTGRPDRQQGPRNDAAADRGLPHGAGRQGRGSRDRCDAPSLARADRGSRHAGGQGCLHREAGQPRVP